MKIACLSAFLLVSRGIAIAPAFVKDAGQYDVQLVPVKSVTLAAEGNTHNEYVTREHDRRYRLNIPRLEMVLDLRV